MERPMNKETVECIEWIGGKTRGGYGSVTLGGRTGRAHRLAYEIAYGPIPPGLFVMHSCDNPSCINPAHLSVGTAADNHKDMMDKGRSHWQRGRVEGGMPPAEFVAALATLGLSVRQYAEMTGISHNTMRHWAEARIATPEPHAEWLRRNVAIRLADPAPMKETR